MRKGVCMDNQMKSGSGSRMKNVFKVSTLLILGAVLVIYSLLLFTGNVGEKTVAKPQKSSDPKEIKSANKKIESILVDDKYGIIKNYEEKKDYLEIMVDKNKWRKLKLKQKKSLVKDLSQARGAIGLKQDIRVIDAESFVEYASFENNRFTLGELDF